jgi:elongation factor Ts
VKLVAQIRKDTQVSMSKAREALVATNNDLKAAMEWLEKDAAVSGAAKAAKLAGRDAKDGLVGIVVGAAGLGGAIVEMNTETDFVARNPIFCDLVTQIGATSMFLHSAGGTGQTTGALQNVVPEDVLQAPLLPHPEMELGGETPIEFTKTVAETIAEVVGKVGENIKLRRITVTGGKVEGQALQLTGGYVHSTSGGTTQGRIGALVVVDAEGGSAIVHRRKVAQLAKNLAQHIVGFAPKVANETDFDRSAVPDEDKQRMAEDPKALEAHMDEVVLARQQFFMGGGTVADVLEKMGQELGLKIRVTGFVRYGVAEE